MKYYDENIRSWKPEPLYERYLDRLNVEKNKKLLDVACGIGYLIKRGEMRGLKCYGIDISPKRVEIARENSSNPNILVGNAENLIFNDNFFDYVTCIGSLEHIPDMDLALQEMKRVGKNNAKFLIVVPNFKSLSRRIRNKGKKQPVLQTLGLKSWKNLFKSNRFSIKEIFRDKGITPELKPYRRIILEIIRSLLPFELKSNHFGFILKGEERCQ